MAEQSVKFLALERSAGQSVALIHQTDPKSLLNAFVRQFAGHAKTHFITQAAIHFLVRREVDGPVTAVTVVVG